MKTLICALLMIASHSAFAADASTWEGHGTLTDAKGNVISTYELLVENTKDGADRVSDVTVTLPDGTKEKHACTSTDGENKSWKSVCDHATGGGRCFSEGLCINYVEDKDQKAFATMIAVDGPSDMRMLRTELDSGKAVRFFSEKLHKR